MWRRVSGNSPGTQWPSAGERASFRGRRRDWRRVVGPDGAPEACRRVVWEDLVEPARALVSAEIVSSRKWLVDHGVAPRVRSSCARIRLTVTGAPPTAR